MKFLREGKAAATKAIAKVICDGLSEGKRVLWLTSGGSNIAIEKDIMDLLQKHAFDHLTSLAIMPMDERYGHPGHKDSNTQQLRDAGFDPGPAILADVLTHDMPFEQTVSFYNDLAATALAGADIVVGQFGMGPDGHVAGIKPDSPAATVDDATVAGYEWEDYTRMTLLPSALKQITHGFLLTYGKDRRFALTHLRANDQTFSKLPAVLLYEIPEVDVYNDQIESED